MPVLLKVLRATPDISFAGLAEELGRQTAAWYSERNLARTEEPALWIPGEKPKLLSGLAAENVVTATQAEQADGTTTTTSTTNKPSGKQPEASPTPAELPAVWKEIQRVSAKDYPDADGVALRRHVSYSLGSHPAIVSEQDEFIQILTPEGKQFGDFDVTYYPPHEELTFLDCEVLSPDGKISRLNPDTIGETHEQAAGDYQTGRRKFFSLPGVVPGAVLHVRYRTEWKSFPLPQISMEIPMGEEMPVRESVVSVTVPKDSAFHFGFDGIKAGDPELKQGEYGTTYSWRFENLPAHRREVLASRHQKPRLMVSTFKDWGDFAGWYDRISQLTDEVTPEIAAKAKELTSQAKSPREKVLAVYNYVTRLRYVAIPLGVNSFRPHAAANVLQNQFGDCKDKANLFNTLLRAVDIDARLVLVPRFSQANEAIPGLAFNHAISRVKFGGEIAWVDTTDEVCRFGLLPPGDPGRKVLVMDGQARELTQLPQPNPSEHRLKILGKVDCSGPAEALPMTMQAMAFGFADYELRATAHEVNEHRTSVPLLQASFRPVAGAFALEKQTSTPVSALEETFTWHGEGTCVGLSSAGSSKVRLHSPFWVPREWDLALHHREQPLFLNQGYPLTLEEEFELALPAKAQPGALPGVRKNDEGPLRWRIEWARIGDDKVAAKFRAELVRGELSAAETEALQRQLRGLVAALGEGVEF
jgi:hypothetical protein